MKKYVGGMIVIVGVILAAVSLAGPWWSFRAQAGADTLSGDFGLFQVTASSTASGQTETLSENYARYPRTGATVQFSLIVAVVALILGALGAGLAFLGGRKPIAARAGGMLAVVGGILAIVSALNMMTSFMGSLGSDFQGTFGTFAGFWGSSSQSGLTYSWGAGWGWYLVVFAGILLLAGGAVATAMKARAPYAAPGYGYAPGAPPPMYPGQPSAPPPQAYGAAPAAYAPPAPSYAPAYAPTPAPTYAVPAPMSPPPPAPPPAAPPPAAGPFCANCGASLAFGAKFCAKCGTPQPGGPAPPVQAAPQAPPGAVVCRSCGSQNPMGTTFCMRCGSRLAY